MSTLKKTILAELRAQQLQLEKDALTMLTEYVQDKPDPLEAIRSVLLGLDAAGMLKCLFENLLSWFENSVMSGFELYKSNQT